MPLRGLAALLLLGGIVYALLSENWGIEAIALGVLLLGLNRLRVAQGRPDRTIGWVLLVLCGALTIVFTAIRMGIGVYLGSFSAWSATNS